MASGKGRRRRRKALGGDSIIGRREFLRLGAIGAGATVAFAVPVRAHHGASAPQRVTVFRLSTHGQRCCGACITHAANHYFQSAAAADGHRPHPGCNCAIVMQPVPPGIANAYFRNGPIFDGRTDRGPQRE